MAKVTEDLRVEIPEEFAKGLGIRPGDEVEWRPEIDGLHLSRKPLSREERLAIFDEIVARQMERQKNQPPPTKDPLTQEYVDDIYNDELRAYAQQVLDHPDWTPEQYAAALGSTPDRIFILTQWLNRGWTRDELYERDRSP